MSENNESRNRANDEIDLLDLFNRMGKAISRWLSVLWKAFLISLVFIIRRWIPLGLSIIVGFGVSLLFKSSSTTYYTSDMVLKGNSANSVELYQYLSRFHTICADYDSVSLAKELNLEIKGINNIVDLSTQYIIDVNHDSIPDYVDYSQYSNINDTTNFEIRMKDRVNVQILIKTPRDLTKIRDGIISFIEKDSIFQQRTRLRLRQNQELISRIEFDILQLDSLQKIKYFEETRENQPKTGGQMVFLQQQSTQLVYGDIYSLYSKKQVLESEQILNKGIVTVLSDFSVPVKKKMCRFFIIAGR